jgi:hypothetical protein
VASYDSWQWNGFSRSSVPQTGAALAGTPVSAAASFQAADTPTASGTASLSGVVYFDANGNSNRDASDWGVFDGCLALTAAGSSTETYAMTGHDGSYSFKNLAADTYTITLLNPSSQPGSASVGTLYDGITTVPAAAWDVVSGQNSITNIKLGDGYVGVNYDFAQLVYPVELISKRMLLNTDPGFYHTTPVPEPGGLTLAAVVGLLLGGLMMWRGRRKRNGG